MAEKSTLIYDGACKFCIQNVSFLERVLGTIFEKRSFREDGFIQEFPNVPLSECEQTVILLTSDGTKYKGAEAFVKLCQTKGGAYKLVKMYYIPGIKQITDWLYQNIARYRFHLNYWK